MCVAKAFRAVTRQGVFIRWRCIDAIKPSLVPLFGVTVEFGMREGDFLPFLNRHPAQFRIGSIRELCVMVEVKEIPKQFDGRFLLQINLTKDLEVADVGHRIGTDVLRAQLKIG